ncbi:DUF4145 domain-containing protein [Arenibacter sp. M-2]|uniref:DUF4145 domain-containing protein n=1 Tax=Arenibacter sp. M-2 TaxID=3053612 RepID=UPI002570824F|nr:DUF4145 domain-containing protein [Arenibacter sp. M-2]MDL5511721.1 DUF4145 domain-containing protein [Arenibacter sp. M-2]
MDIKIWTKRHFSKDSNFEWPCPNCKSQSLELLIDRFFQDQSAESKRMREDDEFWQIEWIDLIFSGALRCSVCSEYITFTGRGNPEPNGYYDYELDQHHLEYDEVFVPSFFEPALRIFDIPDQCPELVKNEIINSFKLFWSDLPASANRIRTSLEIIMNENKVKRFEIIGNQRKPISLHKRILIFNNPGLTELLLAIKWIGNTGSHLGNLQTIDILEAYRLLEYTLTKLYDNQEKEILKITKEINKRKGTRKRK